MFDDCVAQADFVRRIAHACEMPSPVDPALHSWLAQHVPSLREPMTLQRFAGGQSNPTYALEAPGARFVLRAKPAGPLLPSAHQIEREYRVLRALEETPVPVPRALVACDDPTIFGTPFYIMEYLDGRVFTDPALPGIAPADRRAMYTSAFETLADLHHVDFRDVGLTDFGRTEGYLARQVARWTKQYRASQTDPIPSMDALIAWLPVNAPSDTQTAIAHGDYRIGNLIFAPDEPRVIGILDWELSTIGDPLLDLAYAVLMHDLPIDVLRGMGGSQELASVAGIPNIDELIETYSRRAQRARPAELHFYLALAFFRSAAIMQGIRYRITLGNAAGGPQAQARAAITPRLADLGWDVVRAAPV